MEYSNADLSVGQTDLSYVELPKICISVYKEIVKEMAEVIKDARIRDIFLLPFYRGRRIGCLQENKYFSQKSGIYV